MRQGAPSRLRRKPVGNGAVAFAGWVVKPGNGVNRMYKAKVTVAYGTGAPFHQYYSGTGSALSKSPKRAIAQATRKADAASDGGPDNGGLVFIGGELVNLDTGKATPLFDYVPVRLA